MKRSEYLRDNIREHFIVAVFIALMGIVYIITMFANKPWYDELYTYYYFISRGPLYAAIHWPVPNNHVGYSVLSAILDVFGNSYIGLRGVSCIAAIVNLFLLYTFACRFMNKYYSTAVTMLYAGTYLVHRLSVQGRGYTLATTCYLLALISLHNICLADAKRRDYIIFAAMLVAGLYIVPSSLYWVMPTCFVGGLFLLLKKQYERFGKLFVAALVAALITLVLYSIIWMAIGANLLSKDAESVYFGISQIKVALRAPLNSLNTGREYMFSTPYIQSIRRSECVRTMPEYFKNLFDNFYSYSGITTFMACVCLLILGLISAVKQIYYRRIYFMASLYVIVTLATVPIMLLIQSVQPYLRVFGFYSIPIYFGVMYMISTFCEYFANGRMARKITLVTMGLAALLSIGSLLRPYYREPYAGRENTIEGAVRQVSITDNDKVYYTDDYTKYVLKFYQDVTPEEVERIEDADIAVMCPEMFDSKYGSPEWPVLYGYHVARLKYAENDMEKAAENDGYCVFVRAGQ